MRRFHKVLSWLLSAILLCSMLPLTLSAVAETENMIQNGDFETGNYSGWNVYQSTVVSADAAKSGNYGIHAAGNGGWGGMANQTISNLVVGKTYRISLYYKALNGGVNIKLCAGTTDAGDVYAYTYGTAKEWTHFAVEFEATETEAFFTLIGSGTGVAESMYLDDITLTEVVLGGDDDDVNLKMVDTLMKGIKTQGRTALVGGTLMLDFSISGMEFELDCAGDVYATFNARHMANSSADGGVYFTIYVDGVAQERDYCHITSVGETKVLLASDLPAGKHSFAIYRQTEHSFGEVGVCALSFDGEMLERPADKAMTIEFIGDSISCGFGNLGNSSLGDGNPLYADGTRAYTFLTAQALNADWSNVSWSGIGCKYSYGDINMQDVYPKQRYKYDKNAMYSFAQEPDLIVFALGTNDNDRAPDAASKRAGMVEMLTLVREKNPNAPIVWIYNMMTGGVNTLIEEIVEEFGGAEAGYYACKLTQNTAGGGWHPNLAGQQKFAEELVAFLQENGLDEPAPSYELQDLLSGDGTSRMEMSASKLGLAFRFDLRAAGVTANKQNEVVLTNATVHVFDDGVAYKLVGMGALVTNNIDYGWSDEMMMRENANDVDLVDVPARYLYSLDEAGDTVTFAVRVTNIPEICRDTTIFARPYYVFENAEGQLATVYDPTVSDKYSGKTDVNDGVLDWT